MEEDRLPNIAYRREITETNKKFNWALGIKNILDRTGFSGVWDTQGVVHERAFLKSLGRRLKDIFIQEWNAKCRNSARCSTYMTFKNTFKTEHYIKNINISKFMYALARLRVGALGINTNNKHTQSNPDVNCPFCKTEETELHFLRDCAQFQDLRKKHLNPHYNTDNIRNLRDYFETNDITKIRALAQFTFHSVTRRDREIAYDKDRKKYTNRHNQHDQATQTE